MPLKNLTLAVLVVGMAFAAELPACAQTKNVTLFAAASLKTAFDDIAAEWQKETGKRARISYAASGPLARQIEAGAPADIFISADMKWMDYLVEKAAVKKEAVVRLLGNRLVLVAPTDSTVALQIGKNFPLDAALGQGRLAMGDVKSV